MCSVLAESFLAGALAFQPEPAPLPPGITVIRSTGRPRTRIDYTALAHPKPDNAKPDNTATTAAHPAPTTGRGKRARKRRTEQRRQEEVQRQEHPAFTVRTAIAPAIRQSFGSPAVGAAEDSAEVPDQEPEYGDPPF